MTQEQFDFQNVILDFYEKYNFLFKNKVPPATSTTEYLNFCGYSPSKEPLLSGINSLMTFDPLIFDKYKEHFLFYMGGKDGVLYEFTFNLGNHTHFLASVANLPNGNNKPRLAVFPTVYSLEPSTVLQFFKENEEFRIKPDKQAVGFNHGLHHHR